MDELNKGQAFSLTGPARAEALDAFRRRMEEWGVALPPAEPLVWDFGLGRFSTVGLIESWIANEAGPGYCGKYLFVFDGQTCPSHRHRRKHETFFVVRGRVRMILDGEEMILDPGDVLPVDPGRLHSFTGIGPALLLELSTPCEIDDNVFEDERIPIGRNAGGGRS